MQGKWLLFSVSAVLIGVGAGAVSMLHRQGRSAPAAPAAASAPVPADVTLPARIQARQVVSVGSAIEGEVLEMPVEAGQDVATGDLLARVASQGLQVAQESAGSAVALAQARVAKLESTVIAARAEASRARSEAVRSQAGMERLEQAYRRQKMLLGEGATPRLRYEQSERSYLSAKSEYDSLDTLARQAEERIAGIDADLDNARRLLADKTKLLDEARESLAAAEIHAPVDGLLIGVKAEVGKHVAPGAGAEVFDIAVNLAALDAVVEAEPSALARLRPGAAAMIFFADIPGEGIQGAVREVRGNRAVVEFTSPSPLIRPGISAQVRLRLE